MNKFMMSLLCGCAIICAAQTVRAKEDMPPPPPQMELMHKNKPDLAKRLNLSEEQKEKAEAVRLKGREQMKEMHKKMQELRKNNMAEFEKILTPEQKTEFDKIKKEHKMMRKRHRPMHKLPPMGMPNDMPPPPAR